MTLRRLPALMDDAAKDLLPYPHNGGRRIEMAKQPDILDKALNAFPFIIMACALLLVFGQVATGGSVYQ